MKTSTISGTGPTGCFDILQPSYGNGTTGGTSPNIILSATDLINHNADAHGFRLSTDPPNLTFEVTGFTNGSAIHYLVPGTVKYADAFATVYSIPFMQPTIIFEALLYSQQLVTGNDTITINLYKSTTYNTLGTLITSMQLNSSIPTITRLNNFSCTIDNNSYLQVQLVTANISTSYNISFRIGLY